MPGSLTPLRFHHLLASHINRYEPISTFYYFPHLNSQKFFFIFASHSLAFTKSIPPLYVGGLSFRNCFTMATFLIGIARSSISPLFSIGISLVLILSSTKRFTLVAVEEPSLSPVFSSSPSVHLFAYWYSHSPYFLAHFLGY